MMTEEQTHAVNGFVVHATTTVHRILVNNHLRFCETMEKILACEPVVRRQAQKCAIKYGIEDGRIVELMVINAMASLLSTFGNELGEVVGVSVGVRGAFVDRSGKIHEPPDATRN